MRALVFNKSVALRDDYPDPIPGPNECLVSVRRAGICATDLHITNGYMDFRGVLGHEMVGVVERGPQRWRGCRVACEINCICERCDLCRAGLSNHCRQRTVMGIQGRDGCFAERVAVPVRNLHEVPDAVGDEEAVFIEPLAAAYQVLQQVHIDDRMRVSVIGSGKLGLLVGQVLAATGCRLEVVGRNPLTLTAVEKLGLQPLAADEVTAGRDRDVVVDCTGSPEGMELAMRMVRPRGTLVLKSTSAGPGGAHLAPLVIHEVTVVGSRCGPFPVAINALARRAVNLEPLIARIYDLSRGLEALRHAARPGTLKIILRMS